MMLPVLNRGFALDTFTVPRGPLYRVYWHGVDPLEPSVARGNRYDCPDPPAPQFGVLYLAFNLEICWIETVVRDNMVRPAGSKIRIRPDKMTNRWVCEVNQKNPLTLATFADEPLIHLGECASNIMMDSYIRTKRWSQLLYAHANPKVDGLAYRSRFKTDQFCIALFDRAVGSRGLTASSERSINPATSIEAQAIMRRYGIVPGPRGSRIAKR